MTKKKKKKTGAARMRQLDYRPVQVWFKREDLNKIKKAAEKKGQTLAEFIRVGMVKESLDVLLEAKWR